MKPYKIIILGIVILMFVILFTGCSTINDFMNPGQRQDRDSKTDSQRQAEYIAEYRHNCDFKTKAWGSPYTESRKGLLLKVDPTGEKLTMKTAKFYSLPYLTIFCPTKDDLINFEKYVDRTGSYQVRNSPYQTHQIVGTQCYRLNLAYTAVGIKLDSFKQGQFTSIKVVWENEQAPYPSPQIAWVSDSLNTWIIEYDLSDTILKRRQMAFRARMELPDEPTDEYKDLKCNNYLNYQKRTNVG